MPLSKYFKGDGEEVMRSMVARYGAKKGRQVFYATANARHMTPLKHAIKRSKKRATRPN